MMAFWLGGDRWADGGHSQVRETKEGCWST